MRFVLVMLVAVGCSFDSSGFTYPDDTADVDAGLADPATPDAAPMSMPPDAQPPPRPPPDAGCVGAYDLCEEHGEPICVDLQNDDRNCGECGNRCGGSEICLDGECQDKN